MANTTMYRTTLTSGTSYTVPAGVSSLNVTCIGGGGGGPGANSASTHGGQRGHGGQIVHSIVSTTPGASITYAIGAGGNGTTGPGTATVGGSTTFTGATTAVGGNGGGSYDGSTGQIGISANNGGGAGGYDGVSRNGGAGGSGCVIIEYWA